MRQSIAQPTAHRRSLLLFQNPRPRPNLFSRSNRRRLEKARLRRKLPLRATPRDPELLSEFFLEAADHLTTIETQLLRLEHEPGDQEAINAIFRGFHTIKGLAGF